MRTDYAALFAVSIAVTASIVAYPDLPPQIPPRLGREGAFVGAPFLAFLLPVTAIAVWWLIQHTARQIRGLGTLAAMFVCAFHVVMLVAFVGREPRLVHALSAIVAFFLIAAISQLRTAGAALLLVGLGVGDANAQGIRSELIEDLPAFIDATAQKLMQERHVVGSAVVAVHGDRVIFSRGYGKPVLDRTEGVDPARTVFRIGSLTKVFTAAAAVQLAEGGQLDLHRDVREILPDIPLRYGVTTHQLLTHTAGFDERFAGAYTDSPKLLQPLGDHVRRYLPPQVFRPGTTSSYSNYNYALAGLVIERVSGRTYEQYMAERIFTPLDMTSTSAAQPPAPNLVPHLARGYSWDGEYEPLPYTYTHGTPAGSMTTTAADLGRFMIAMLEGGAGILKTESVERMLTAQWAPHPRSVGIPYGFGLMRWNGERLLVRGGTLGDQSAFMLLIPDHRIGLVVLSNVLPGIGDSLFNPLMTHLAGPLMPASISTPLPNAVERAHRYVGTYRPYRHARHEMSRVRALMPMMQQRVTVEPDGAIRWQGQRWREIEPLLFQSERNGDIITFHENERGLVAGVGGYERLRWVEQTSFQMAILLPSLGLFVWYLMATAVRAIRRRPPSPSGAVAQRCALFVAAANVAFLVGLLVFLRDFGAITPLPLPIAAWLSLPMMSVAVTSLLPAFATIAWKERWWGTWERVRYSAIAVAAVAFMTFLNYWKLLGFRY